MPSPPSQPCPSTMALEAHLAGDHPDEPLAEHLRCCATCQAAVEEIRANNKLMAQLLSADLQPDSRPTGQPDGGWSVAPATPAGYRIASEIHRGAQGVVYRAVQLATQRPVALKVLLAGALATSRQRRRFERECELVAQLEHPHVVTVYDSGVTAQGCPYLAMQFVDGWPLDEWLRDWRAGPRSRARSALPQLLRLFVKLCAGINHAHQHGVIHRDLKPANVIVDRDGEPHVVDFGLAKLVAPPAGDARAAVTQEGALLGTLAYAAPEQVRGQPRALDVRADVYALGVILFEMLTGQLPFSVEGDLADVLHRITSTDPQPPSACAPPDAGGSPPALRIDDELDTIVLKSLAKEKERRYQSAAALRDDVQRYLRREPIEAKRDSTLYVLRKLLVRHWVQASTAGAFVVLLIGFGGAMSFLYGRAQIEAAKARQVNVFLEDTLSSVEPGGGEREVTVRELLDEATQWIDIALTDHPEVAASIQATIGNSYRNLGLLDRAEPLLESALATRRTLFGERDAQVAQSLFQLGQLRHAQQRYDEAERLYLAALDLYRELLGEARANPYLLGQLACLRRDQGRFAEAQQLLQRSLAMQEDRLGPENASVALTLYRLGEVATDLGELGAARDYHERALNIQRSVLHVHHPDITRSLDALASLLLRLGQADSAEPLLRECLALRRAVLHPGHWRIAATQAQLGRVLCEREQYAEAEQCLLIAAARLEEQLGVADPRTQSACRDLADLYERLDQPETAATWRAKLGSDAGTPGGAGE